MGTDFTFSSAARSNSLRRYFSCQASIFSGESLATSGAMNGLPDLVPVQALVCTQNGQWAEMPSSFMPRLPNAAAMSLAFFSPPLPSPSM